MRHHENGSAIMTGQKDDTPAKVAAQDWSKLRAFDQYCTCGGSAWRMNGRPQSDPHMSWCPQKPQYDQWFAATGGVSVYANERSRK